ncbi:TniQ family protein [Colwellia polaris]|jgi:hypothetical protein|uniref:TniQ family protein n=1 Tax=Colwellia polaris TaxID=326537 RepID=UPI000A17378F|nr:TniQ family protein [Colwellia polaris]
MKNNKIALEFPVRPRPLDNESIDGYLLRLGLLNGRDTRSRIASVLGVNLADSIYEVASPRYKNIAKNLSKSVRLETEQLDAFFKPFPLPIFDNNRFIKKIVRPVPRVCTTCCSHEESRYIKQDWHLAHHTHCEIHKVRLIEKCPCCQFPLHSNATILCGCSKCGLQWEDYSAIPTDIPNYQLAFKSLSNAEKEEYISALYKALVIVSRPYDCAFEPLRRMPDSDVDIVHQLSQAFDLLISKRFRSELNDIRKARLLADEKLLFLTNKQVNRLALLPSIPVPRHVQNIVPNGKCSPIVDNKYINKARERFLIDGTEYCYQVSKDTVSTLLELDIKAIDYLIDSKKVKFTKQTGSLNGAFVHLYEIDLFIKMLTKSVIVKSHVGDVDNLISMEKLRKGLKFFNTDLAKLISILIDNSVQLYYCSPVVTISFNQLYVDRDDITTLLEEQFIPSFNEQVSNAKIRQMCFLKPDQYHALKTKFDLSDIEVKYKYSYVSQEKLTAFFTKYILLNRWIKIHDVKLKALVKYLDSQPDLERNLLVNEYNIVLYENTENLKKALNRFLILTSGEPQKLAAFCL